MSIIDGVRSCADHARGWKSHYPGTRLPPSPMRGRGGEQTNGRINGLILKSVFKMQSIKTQNHGQQ